MKSIIGFLILAVTLAPFLGDAAAGDLDVSVQNHRHAYYRGETIAFSIRVTSRSDRAMKKVRIQASTAVLGAMDYEVDLPARGAAELTHTVDSTPLRAQRYQLSVAAVHKDEIATTAFPFTVAHRPNPQRLPVVYWGGSAGRMEWGLMHGFNTFSISRKWVPMGPDTRLIETSRQRFDDALEKGANLGIYFHTLIAKEYEGVPDVFAVTPEGEPYERRKVVAYHPVVRQRSEATTRRAMELYGDHPAFFHSLINSEYSSRISYDGASRRRVREALGLGLEDLPGNPLRPGRGERQAMDEVARDVARALQPVDGIIEDDNPYYRFYMWWWKEGMGDVGTTRRISDIIHESRPDIVTWHDPYRLAPVYGRHAGLSAIGQWTYTFPDPKYTLYVETLIAGAKPENQMVMPDITTWEYGGWLAPEERGHLTMPYQILRETAWLNLSRSPDMLCHYISSRHTPANLADQWARDPRLFEEMRQMSERVYKPYGPAIRLMERTPRKVAILSSGASGLFPNAGQARRGYVSKQIYDFYSALQWAHVPADVVFDETIRDGGLKDYDILILHLCETLPRSVYREVLAFQKRGGLVFGDSFLRADVPTAARFDFDFSHRRHMDVDRTKTEGRRLTADEDRDLMLGYARELRRAFEGKYTWPADADSEEVLLNLLEHGDATYLFAVNDRRTYGERFRTWKTMHTEGVPVTARIRVATEADAPALYDLMAMERIAYQRDGDAVSFELTLGPCDGTIVGIYPEAIDSVHVDVPPALAAGDSASIPIVVTGFSGRAMAGVHPLRVEIQDAHDEKNDISGYYAAEDGRYELSFVPALNDPRGVWRITVKELTAGRETTAAFTVE